MATNAEIVNDSATVAAADGMTALPATPGIGGGEILSLGISMIIVVAVILVLGWLYSRSRFVGGGRNDVISVVASRARGPKERLLVVEVDDQQLLVGMTASNVQTLHVFEKPVRPAAAAAATNGFAGRLRSAIAEVGK